MFILVVFGYRQSRLFTIDCLTATLMDSIWQSAHKELQSNFIKREELFNKEKITLQKKIAKTEARLEQIEKEEDKPIEGVNVLAKKADPKKAAPPAKKGKDQAAATGSPAEAEKLELLKDLEKSKDSLIKYDDKIEKMKAVKNALTDLEADTSLIIELFDKQGERKFTKTKVDTVASSFLSDKNTYVLGYYTPTHAANEEENVLALEYEGYCVRTVEEDETAGVEEPLLAKKDDKKKGKKGK